MKKFEYKKIRGDELIGFWSKMYSHGEEGWDELVKLDIEIECGIATRYYTKYQNREDVDEGDELDKPYFWTLPIPKERTDKYAPRFVTNSSDDDMELRNMGLKPGQYFIEILDFDGLGFCTTEEELEILYRALTSKYIEE